MREAEAKRSSQETTPISYVVGGVSLYVGRCGEHASPKGEFSVRGHYRHYKSGKIVWINEYRKGEGKRNGKKYCLSKKDAESLQR